jgi:spore germination protein GerM
MAMILQFPDELVKESERLNLKVVTHAEGVTLEVQSTLEQEIRKWQLEDAGIQKNKESMKQGEAPDFTEDEQGTVWFKNRLCVPETGDLRETILREARDSAYSIHPGSTKMYQDLK